MWCSPFPFFFSVSCCFLGAGFGGIWGRFSTHLVECCDSSNDACSHLRMLTPCCSELCRRMFSPFAWKQTKKKKYELVIWIRALLTSYSMSEDAAVLLKHRWAGAETDSASSSAKYLNCCLVACSTRPVHTGCQREKKQTDNSSSCFVLYIFTFWGRILSVLVSGWKLFNFHWKLFGRMYACLKQSSMVSQCQSIFFYSSVCRDNKDVRQWTVQLWCLIRIK